MIKPGWCTPDHHLPYWNGLCSSACWGLFIPLPWSFCSVPLSVLIKISASTKRWRWALRHESPIFPQRWVWRYEFPIFPERWALRCESLIFRIAGIWINHFPLHQHLPLKHWLLNRQAPGPAFGFSITNCGVKARDSLSISLRQHWDWP